MPVIKDTLIVINSAGRAGEVRTPALFPMNPAVIDYKIAVPHDQFEKYIKHDARTIAIPEGVPKYLSSQRQWVMEEFMGSYKFIWLMDDDLTFLKRGPDMKLTKATQEDIEEMFQLVHKHLQEIPMVAISTRLGNNRVTEDYDEINRVTRCYAMSTAAFKEVGATFAPFEPFFAQDFHMTVCWLNKGFPNRILYTFAQEDRGSNANGGCSNYRNFEAQKKVSLWMERTHPEIKAVAKSSANWKGLEGKGSSNYRIDMTVQWKKAYRPKRKSGGLAERLKRNKG